MVSLTKNLEYYSSLVEKPKILAFKAFLENKKVIIENPSEANEADSIYYNLISAFVNDNIKQFVESYNLISVRKPSSESVWIHDNFLIFVLICCIEKFNADRSWINEVLQIRTSSNPEYQSINQTFKNILSSNYASNDNQYAIIIVYLDLINKPMLSNEVLNNVYGTICDNAQLFISQNDYLIMISLRAYNVIILTKDTPDAIEITQLKAFRVKFLRRIMISTNIIYIILLSVFVIIGVSNLRKYQNLKDYLNDTAIIFQIGGIGLIVALKWIKSKIEKILLRIFGYTNSFKIK